MLLSDILITISIWAYYPQIVPLFDGSSCLIASYALDFILWVMLNDIVISVYCMVVFVYPLRSIIIEERKQNQDANICHAVSERSIEEFVRRIIFCSLITSLSIIITGICIASSDFVGPFVIEIDSFIGCYMVVMQFKDIDPAQCQWKLGKALIRLFEWNFWCCWIGSMQRQTIQLERRVSNLVIDACRMSEILETTRTEKNKEVKKLAVIGQLEIQLGSMNDDVVVEVNQVESVESKTIKSLIDESDCDQVTSSPKMFMFDDTEQGQNVQ